METKCGKSSLLIMVVYAAGEGPLAMTIGTPETMRAIV